MDAFQWLEEPLFTYMHRRVKYIVIRSIYKTSGRTPGLCWRSPTVPGNHRLKNTDFGLFSSVLVLLLGPE